MNRDENIMKWVVGVATAAAIGLGTWNFNTVSSTATRVSVQEERVTTLKEQLTRIERKLDRVLERER